MRTTTHRQREGHTVARRSWAWRSAAVLCGAAVIGALVVMSWPPQGSSSTRPTEARRDLIAAQRPVPASPRGATRRPMATLPGAEQAASTAASTASGNTQPLADNEVRVCGLGVVRVDDDAPLPQDHIPAATRASARSSLDTAMTTHHDARTRAAALLMRVRTGLTGDAVIEAREQDAACRFARIDGTSDVAPFCGADAARRQADLMAPLLPSIDQLARMAAASGDPVMHAFAQEACEPHGLSHVEQLDSCQLAGAAAWARAAPDAAEPWLLLAAQAQARGDAAAITQALARAAQARQIDASAGSLVALATRALPISLPPLVQASAHADLATLDDSAPHTATAAVQELCGTPALEEDPARRDHCAALARLMTGQGRAANTVTAGVQLGERLGWAAEHTSAIVREHRAALEARQQYLGAGGGLSCEALERRRKLAALTAQVGEIEALRRLAER
jgi:hypothetical protein